jgi:aspartate kinase
MPGTVVGVASERDTLVLTLTPAKSSGERPAADLLALLDSHSVAGKQLHESAGQLTLIISRENLHDEPRVRAALADRFGSAVTLADDLGAVSVIGAGINASFDNLRRGSGALEAAGIAMHGIATSSFRITWMIPRARLEDAVRTLHAQLVR